jgi:hypothetical protein
VNGRSFVLVVAAVTGLQVTAQVYPARQRHQNATASSAYAREGNRLFT